MRRKAIQSSSWSGEEPLPVDIPPPPPREVPEPDPVGFVEEVRQKWSHPRKENPQDRNHRDPGGATNSTAPAPGGRRGVIGTSIPSEEKEMG